MFIESNIEPRTRKNSQVLRHAQALKTENIVLLIYVHFKSYSLRNIRETQGNLPQPLK